MKQQSPIDEYRPIIEHELARNTNYQDIASIINDEAGSDITSRHSVRRAIKRWRLDGGSLKLEGDSLEVTSPPRLTLNSDRDLLQERGFDPEEWEVTSVTINEWDSPTGETLKQLKVNARKIKPLNYPVPAREPNSYIRPKRVRVSNKKSRLVVFVGDQHAPFHNVDLHERFLNFLREQQPAEGVLLGDLVDFADISRHPADPDWSATTQVCLDSAYKILLDYIQASDNTEWVELPGNHEERLRRSLIDRLPDLAALKRASIPEEDSRWNVASIPFLLRLDELGVEYVQPRGSYDHAQHQVSSNLAARHGWIAKKGAGTSALATLGHLGYSFVQGHSHRQSLVHKTTTDINGTTSTLAAVESGCMCTIEGGLGYAPSPDWQNGFATAEVYPDGKFKMDLATFVGGELYWRGERY